MSSAATVEDRPDAAKATHASSTAVISPPRVVATGLDAAVRATRAGASGLIDVGRRVADLWKEDLDLEITFEATSLKVAGQTALEARGVEGRWILPTFMSGLRMIRATKNLDADDVLRLAEELASLEPEADSLAAFQSWLWSDGAEGFEVDLAPSFVEMIEVVSAELEAGGRDVLAVRGEAAFAMSGDLVEIASSDLDAAAVRREFQVPLDSYHRGIAASSFELDDAERARLARSCDDSAAWIAAETLAVLERPELSAAIPAPRLARRIVGLASSRLDPGLLRQLAALERRDDPYSTSLFQALEAQGLDEALARAPVSDAPDVLPAIREFMSVASPTLAKGVIRSLIRSAAKRPQTFTYLVDILGTGSPGGVLEAVDFTGLHKLENLTLARALLNTGTASHQFSTVLQQMPASSAARILADVPPKLLLTLKPAVEKLLASDSSEARETVAQALLSTEDRRALRLLREQISGSHVAGLAAPTVRRILEALIQAGILRDAARSLVRSRTAPVNARIAALDALAAKPRTLAEAARWRFTELFDPPTLRQRLREARRHLRTAS